MKSRYLSLFSAAVLFLGFSVALPAHEDERLKKALSQDQVTLRQYQVASLAGQLANIYAQLKKDTVAKQMLDRVRDARSAIRNPYVRQAIAGDTANEVASGDFEHALRLLNGIEDTELWVKTAWKLARKLGKDEKTEIARKLLDECVGRSRAVNDLELRAELISGTGANYRYVDAAQGAPLVYESYGLAQTISDPFDRAIMFNEVGAHLMDIGDRERAVAVFDLVSELVNNIDDPLKQSQVLVMLGGEQAEKGLRDRAAVALERGVKIAMKVPVSEEQAAVVSEFARNFGQSHRFERGIEVARSISDPYHRAEGLIRIAKNMHREGKLSANLQLLNEIEDLTSRITDPYLKGVALRKLAAEFVDVKQPEKARPLLAIAVGCVDQLDQLARGSAKK